MVTQQVLNPDGSMNIVWYRFFQSLTTRSGLQTPGFGLIRVEDQVWDGINYPARMCAQVAYHKEDTNLYSINVYEQTTGALLGTLLLDPIPR